jgi:iron-sulfur cluster repair protein YtfE (RIC family)
MLEHHHTCEDRDLWPMLVAHAPHLADDLDALTEEHDRLQEDLDALAITPVGSGQPAAARLAASVRDLVREHLIHEERVLFPALDRYVSPGEWDAFSIRTVASTPQEGLPFMLALIDEVGSAADAEVVFRHVPAEGRETMPARRAEGQRELSALRATAIENGAVR